MTEVKHTLDHLVTEVKRDGEHYTGANEEGYGSNIKSPYMIKYDNRWRRVFAVCWSNAASHFIKEGSKKMYLSPKAEHLIEEARDRS